MAHLYFSMKYYHDWHPNQEVKPIKSYVHHNYSSLSNGENGESGDRFKSDVVDKGKGTNNKTVKY